MLDLAVAASNIDRRSFLYGPPCALYRKKERKESGKESPCQPGHVGAIGGTRARTGARVFAVRRTDAAIGEVIAKTSGVGGLLPRACGRRGEHQSNMKSHITESRQRDVRCDHIVLIHYRGSRSASWFYLQSDHKAGFVGIN